MKINTLTIAILLLSGCAAGQISPINTAPDGTYTPHIEWDIQSIEWGYQRAPVNWCSIRA